MTLYRPRDENGWRIPQVGTKSRLIYELLKQGKRPCEIAAILSADLRGILVLSHRFRRWQQFNKKGAANEFGEKLA